ncbi:MAG TPA: hypothetical protein DCX03_00760 [Bacteroidales bacterium]|nr:hypothetical protein [Bacteroidales bacterium]
MDTLELIKHAKRAEKQGVYDNPELKVAVLGTCSIQYVCKVLRYVLFADYGIKTEIFEGEYNGISLAVLEDMSEYHAFQADVTVILPDCSETSLAYWQNIWSKADGQIFQSNFVVPDISSLGNLEMNIAGSVNFNIMKANLEFVQAKPRNVSFLDLESLASNIGKNRWFDYTAFFMSKLGFSLNYLGDVCSLIARQIAALKGKTRKCLVLDLDNTLWGGVVGDDGFDGINLAPNDAVGESYRFFQKYVLSLKERGIILAICSKNNEDTAKEPFIKNQDMLIKLEDISCFIANWNDKATNIRQIAKYLNIGVDSLVFFDDNPAEREIVRLNVPEVAVIDVPKDPAYYAKALSDSGIFDWLQITDEDLTRAKSYSTNKQRAELETSFVNYDEYLNALEMKYTIGFLDEKRIARFAQLINKSNQFNLRTQRYSEADIAAMMNDSAYKLIYAELSDKFDNYGLIACAILREDFIDTWVMSCRVLKRKVEDKMFEFILQNIKGDITGEYLPSPKNSMVKDFYKTLGFEETGKENIYVFSGSK